MPARIHCRVIDFWLFRTAVRNQATVRKVVKDSPSQGYCSLENLQNFIVFFGANYKRVWNSTEGNPAMLTGYKLNFGITVQQEAHVAADDSAP